MYISLVCAAQEIKVITLGVYRTVIGYRKVAEFKFKFYNLNSIYTDLDFCVLYI